nr:hypothetical protein CFP56_52418 [Quercus suber]
MIIKLSSPSESSKQVPLCSQGPDPYRVEAHDAILPPRVIMVERTLSRIGRFPANADSSKVMPELESRLGLTPDSKSNRKARGKSNGRDDVYLASNDLLASCSSLLYPGFVSQQAGHLRQSAEVSRAGEAHSIDALVANQIVLSSMIEQYKTCDYCEGVCGTDTVRPRSRAVATDGFVK